MASVFPPPENPESPICSAKGCRLPAVWVLAWNNPKLHTPDRRKTWLACDEHRESLSSFLDMRGFLKDVVRLEEWEDDTAGAPGQQRPQAPGGTENGSGSATDR